MYSMVAYQVHSYCASASGRLDIQRLHVCHI
ncbi:Protein of unknown function [Pyronema omphalodes CBS 100304]|uniref:Uncharacterized protein n=1 Tax=Pyronema omphalodes (strain CBS 100304) TaxID=1076935 RepID=U4LBP1_PYROM|nr:Protein of unknown function [Pyronema omphalodes CBS 100304]